MTTASRERRLALAVALGGAVVVLDTTVTVVAVPVLVRVLDSSLATLQWTTTAYVLALIATLPLSAALASRFGARRTYVAALLVFGLGSLLATLAVGPATLIAARVVQGLGGGLVNPVGMVLALRGVPAERRGAVTSILGLPLFLGILGPVLAGWLVEAVSWRAVFAVTVPPAVLGALFVGRWGPADPVPASGPVRSRPPTDVGGAMLLVPGAVAVTCAAGAAAAYPGLRVVLLVAGSAALAAFVVRSRRRPHPLLRLDLLTHPVVSGGVGVLVAFGAGYFGSMLLMPSYLQTARGLSPGLAGTLLVPAGLATAVTLQVATRLVDRLPEHRVVGAGLALAASSQVATVVVLGVDTSLPVVVLLGVVLGIGSGCVLMPTMTAVTRHLVGDDLASGSTLMGLAQQLATAVGVAVVTGLYSALTPSGAGAGDLVDAQRGAMLLPLASTLLALTLALTNLRRGTDPPRRPDGHQEAEHEPARR